MSIDEVIYPPISPLQPLVDAAWEERGLQVYIKRDDLLAPSPNDPFCGNKWRKLQYNLAYLHDIIPRPSILTFGGPFSNHIAAVASAGRHLSIPTIGIIRGEPVQNPTLARAQVDGMQLHFMDRSTYRQKHTEKVIGDLRQKFGDFYLIPEGGTNPLALKGCAALGTEIVQQLSNLTHLVLACGTGGTLAGLATGLADIDCELLGISALKGDFLTSFVQNLLLDYGAPINPSWQILTNFHHGGYAKAPAVLVQFIRQFSAKHKVQLEPVYTGKVAWALCQLIEQDYFAAGSHIVMLHSGGLQGLVGGLMDEI